MRRNLLLQPARLAVDRRRYHEDPYPVGSTVEVITDVVNVMASLPGQRPRVRAGAHVRILAPIDDPTELVMLYRFEVLDERGHGSGEWSFCEVANLRALPPARRLAWLPGRRG